jgi:predicted porin
MKKSLFAIAAVTAFAGAAQAQSSVTVYGILDVGFVGGHQQGRATGTGNVPSAYTNSTGGQFTGSGSQSTSRLGFRGNEDLGGGLSAFFTLENALAPDSNSIFSITGNGNRQAFAGLGKKGLGRAAIGTQYTPMFNNVSSTSPGQLNNVMGDIIFGSGSSTAIFGLQDPVPSTARGGAAALQNQNSNQSNDIGFTVRTANMLRIDTDSLAGFRGQAFYTMDNSNSNQGGVATPTNRSGGVNDRNGWGLGANYTMKKLFVAANYQSLTATNPYASATNGTTTPTVTAATAAAGNPELFGTAVNSGINIKDNQWFAGAMYDFGVLKAYAQYVNRKATSQISATQYATRTAQQIGVRGNWTPKIESWASIGTGRYSQFGVSNPTANFNGWQVGSNYILSKRTNLYGIYGATNTSTTTRGSYYNGSQYAVGVRHTF